MTINKEGLRVAVVGSRDFEDRQRLYEVLDKNKAKIKIIVSGGARGADTLATSWASDNGVPYLVFPAAWRNPDTGEHDRGAGFRRNRHIVEYSDIIFAFWDGVSKGTEHTINMAKEAKKRLIIVNFKSKEIKGAGIDETKPISASNPPPDDDPF